MDLEDVPMILLNGVVGLLLVGFVHSNLLALDPGGPFTPVLEMTGTLLAMLFDPSLEAFAAAGTALLAVGASSSGF